MSEGIFLWVCIRKGKTWRLSEVHCAYTHCAMLFSVCLAFSLLLPHLRLLARVITCVDVPRGCAWMPLCSFVCVRVSYSHLCLASRRDQWSRAAIPHHEGRAAQVPPRKLRRLQIRHQPPEQVRVITTQLLNFLHFDMHNTCTQTRSSHYKEDLFKEL